MIVAAVADTHGKTESIRKRLAVLNPDHILFAGDLYKDGLKIASALHIPCTCVVGNCDGSRGRQEETVNVSGQKILVVHGHQYGVKRDLNRLYYHGIEMGVDAVVFGHTHYPVCERINGLWLVNPGSPVSPRLSHQGSFASLEIDENGIKPKILLLTQT